MLHLLHGALLFCCTPPPRPPDFAPNHTSDCQRKDCSQQPLCKPASYPCFGMLSAMPLDVLQATRLMTAHAAAGRWSRTARHIRIVRRAWSADGNCKCTALCYIIRFKQPNKFAFVLSSSPGRWFFGRNNCEYLYNFDRFMHRRDAAARNPAAVPRLFI